MLDYNWAYWTEWTPLDKLDFSTVPSGPGVYVIATDRPIHRVVETDNSGFLDIGEAESLRSRIKAFYRCVTEDKDAGHMAGWRFMRFQFKRQFPVGSLHVRWRSTANKEEAYKEEGRLLHAYLQQHCELPPLNYKFNWSLLIKADANSPSG
jgi:hypothetical protein